MKLEKRKTRVLALLLGFVASFSGIGCLVIGMRFHGISMVTLALVCALAAGITAFLADRKWFVALPGVMLLAILRMWRKGSLKLSLEAFLGHISHLYDLGYGWGVIRWSEEYLRADMAQLTVCLLGIFVAWGVCWSYLKCKSTLIPLVIASLPVIPTMLLTDTVPESTYLYGSLLCLVLLLMLRLTKKRGQGTSLAQLLAIPVMAAILMLFLCMPQKSYVSLNWMDSVFDHVQALFSDSGKSSVQTPVREEGDWVNLSVVGPKSHRRGLVMEVSANESGYLYLKGKAFDTYYGTWWDCRGTSQPTAAAPTGGNRAVKITTRAMHDVLYLPYGAYGIGYSNNAVTLKETKGQVKNEGPWRSYHVKYRQQPESNESWELLSQNAPSMYTQLPRDTLKAAQNYLARQLPQLQEMDGAWSKAQTIINHVSASAPYSLQTPKMPADSTDFAMWFLEESDSGYCVHFATAATVLLRAEGIPCRYVTGYLVAVQANRVVEVEQRNAHAWVECYIDGVGWVPLEPTPSSGISQTAPQPTTEPAQTETTTVPTETETVTATSPALPTLPENTVPTKSTEPPQTSSVATEATSSVGGADGPQVPGDPAGEEEKPLNLSWLKWVLLGLCVPGAVIGQWRLRVWQRMKKRNRGRKNAQALARWQEVVLHSRVRKEAPDEQLFALAQKAKFSHHAVTREELKLFDNWLNGSKGKIQHLSLWQKLLATIVYALY